MKLDIIPKWCFPLLLFLLIMLACIFSCFGYAYYLNNQRVAREKIILEGIAKRTGVSPDWLAVRNFVYCGLLKPGTPRDQVEKGLSLVGQYRSAPDDLDERPTIDFENPSIHYNLSPLVIEYDKSGIVISSGVGEFNHGPRADCEMPPRSTNTPTP